MYTSTTIWKLSYITVIEAEQRWRLHHGAGQMWVCEGSWTPEVFFHKTEYQRVGEEEDGVLINSQEKPRSQ